MYDIMRTDYPRDEWNSYVAQTSDGDNWETDDARLKDMLNQQIIPNIQHFAYLQVGSEGDFRTREGYDTTLWKTYAPLLERWSGKMDMKKLIDLQDVGEVFKDLYRKRTTI